MTHEPRPNELDALPSQVPPAAEGAGSGRPVVVVRRRRWVVPLLLFLATLASTFWVGMSSGKLDHPLRNGLLYMAAVMAILVAHEMGHFVQCLKNRVPASWPYFIPMPLNLLGTMGAVIVMGAGRANRRALFDIGLTGPVAGLLVALPLLAYGVATAEVVRHAPPGTLSIGDPLLVRLMIRLLRPDLPSGVELWFNPFLQASWVGLFMTGVNMLPVGQLDGGHVSYALFGRKSYVLAWSAVGATALYIALSKQYAFSVMLVLVMLLGPHHPPTADDSVPLGLGRRCLGLVSLVLPLLCVPPRLVSIN
jgi:membrane-associated protease RseP (regulator of RpoE activity)